MQTECEVLRVQGSNYPKENFQSQVYSLDWVSLKKRGEKKKKTVLIGEINTVTCMEIKIGIIIH